MLGFLVIFIGYNITATQQHSIDVSQLIEYAIKQNKDAISQQNASNTLVHEIIDNQRLLKKSWNNKVT